MVILYSATQPHLWQSTTANNIFSKQHLELEHSTYIDGGFLIAYFFSMLICCSDFYPEITLSGPSYYLRIIPTNSATKCRYSWQWNFGCKPCLHYVLFYLSKYLPGGRLLHKVRKSMQPLDLSPEMARTRTTKKWWVRDRAVQRKEQQGQQELEARHVSSLLVCFFFFLLLIFYLLNFYLHLELVDDDDWPPPLHTISAGSRCRCVSSSGILNFSLSTTKWLYIFRLCVWSHNQDDDGEWPPSLGRWTGTQDASSVSWVSGMFRVWHRYG